jgi:lipoprotein-anchoring transpeptidase ErfK/SrfK
LALKSLELGASRWRTPISSATLNINNQDSKMTDLGGLGDTVANGQPVLVGARIQTSSRTAFSSSLWRIAALTSAAAIGSASYAEAATFWSDPASSFARARSEPAHRQRAHRSSGKKIEAPVKEAVKPKAPLVIAVSIDKQKVKIYDANGFFAEAPVSTGMHGHPTPMGVFSVIEKDRYHHSNIYSGAPMPYMQRITWSGVAMHAGVLPGYPASHGCIRMPMDFAVRMWGWTKMGARVLVTPAEIAPPVEFSHALLATQKVVPQPVAAAVPAADAPASVSLKTSDLDEATKPTIGQASLELRSTVGHGDDPKPAQTRTADARGAMSEMSAPVTMSDATPSSDARQDSTAGPGSASPVAEDRASVKLVDPSSDDAKFKATSSDAGPSAEKSGEIASTDHQPVDAKSPEAATAEAKPAETAAKAETAGHDASDKAENKSDEAPAPAQASSDTPKVGTAASESVKADETKVEARADVVKVDAPKADVAKAETLKADAAAAIAKTGAAVVAVTNAGPSVPDETKDQGRLPGADKPAAEKPNPVLAVPMRTGQIAVFISRKDSKLYVRQNFKPLFDVPVTIAASDRPLGTHIFTAQVDKDDANVLHWSVVSLPAPAKYVERDEDERRSRKRKPVAAAEPKAGPVPDSPAEALDRLTLPSDVMARIYEAFSTGGSIVVSDQGIRAGETGEGTDFIVSLR